MAASVKAIRLALKDKVNNVPGLRGSDVVVSTEPPVGVVRVESLEYDSSFQGGSHDPVFVVLVLVNPVVDRAAQNKLDDFMDPESSTSVKAAIEADQTLNGTVDFAVVRRVRNSGLVNYFGVDYLGAEFVVETGIE